MSRSRRVVGASVTALRNKLYCFGGRLVETRTMVATLYCLDLATLEWRKLWPRETGEAVEELGKEPAREEDTGVSPRARYFHSAEAVGDSIVCAHAFLFVSFKPPRRSSEGRRTGSLGG